jgi:hypothetical protein
MIVSFTVVARPTCSAEVLDTARRVEIRLLQDVLGVDAAEQTAIKRQPGHTLEPGPIPREQDGQGAGRFPEVGQQLVVGMFAQGGPSTALRDHSRFQTTRFAVASQK